MKMTKLVSASVVTGWARWRFWKERGEDPLGLGLGKNCRWFSGGFHGEGDFMGISDIESTKINQHWYVILGMVPSRDYQTIIVEPCYIPIASETMEFAIPKFTIYMGGNHQSIWVVYCCFTNVRHH